jgi:hypothetical protein
MYNMIFHHEDDSVHDIDIDDLYRKNLMRSMKHLSIFNKILNRVHKRIHTTSKNKRTEQHIWFTIPKFILGEQTYDQGDCIAHVIGKLVDNGFMVKYLHPNTIFVTWEQWIPSYIRDEHFKKTGILIDEKGIPIKTAEQEHTQPHNTERQREHKQFTPINKYKPTGHLLYNADLFEAISSK